MNRKGIEGLITLRKQLGLTQKEVADGSTVSLSTVQRLENPNLKPPSKKQITIIEVYLKYWYLHQSVSENSEQQERYAMLWEDFISHDMTSEESKRAEKDIRYYFGTKHGAISKTNLFDVESLMACFNNLNDNGRAKVISYACDLAQIKRYRKD